MFCASNAKEKERKINQVYSSGGIAKTLKCYLLYVLRRTNAEVFAWPVHPPLPARLPLSSSLVPD